MSESTKQSWKEKLNRCAVPEGVSWIEMQRLLDMHLPTKTKSNRSLYSLLLLLLLFIGICTCPRGEDKKSAGKDLEKKHQGQLASGNVQVKELAGRESKVRRTITHSIVNGGSVNVNYPEPVLRSIIYEKNTQKSSSRVETELHGSLSSLKNTREIVRIKKNSISRAAMLSSLSPADSDDDKVAYQVPEISVSAINNDDRMDSSIHKPGDPFVKEMEKVETISVATPKKGNSGRINIGVGFDYNIPLDNRSFSELTTNGNFRFESNLIPVLSMRYRLSSKAYVQAEFQPIASQYVQSNLLDRKFTRIPPSAPGGAGAHVMQSVYLRKLFYSNLPVSFRYEIAKGLHAGMGIQYSRLRTGVGVYEESRGMPGGAAPIITRNYKEIESGLLNSAVKRGEFSYGVDLVAKIQRLDVGLRYTRAFDSYQYRSFSMKFAEPNQSFHFLVRYNISNRK